MCTKIFSAIFLIVIVAEVHCKGRFPPEQLKCLEKFNIHVPADYCDHLNYDNLSEEEKRILTCAAGCGVKRESEKLGITMYQVVLDTLNKGRFGVYNNVDVLKQKLDTCVNVNEECKFMQCVDIFNPPWKEVVYYNLKLDQ